MSFSLNIALQVALLFNLAVFSQPMDYSPAAESPVQVEDVVSVVRGGTVNLVQVLTFKPESLPDSSVCRVTSLASPNSCGRVSPDIFDCGTYSGPILYQHLGCYAPVELAVFMISAQPVNHTRSSHGISPPTSTSLAFAASFSVEVHVEVAHPLIRQLSVKTDLADPVKKPGVLNVTVLFPSALVGQCKYEVVSGWKEFQFPVSGVLTGTLNQPLPGGLVPVVPWTYHPHGSAKLEGRDYILIKLYTHGLSGVRSEVSGANDSQSYYSLLGFSTNGTQVTSTEEFIEVVSLGRDLLVIRQAMTTPVSSENFSAFNVTQILVGAGFQPTYQGQKPSLRFTFPMLPSGSFQSVSSSVVNVTHTTFSDLDLLSGHVSFHPTELHSSHSFTFPYNVTTVAGVLVATGMMLVFSLERDWSYPSHRANSPLPVAEGGVAAITYEVLDFYLLKPCDEVTKVRVLSPPQHGSLIYANGSHVRNEQLPFLATSSSPFLLYHHSGDETLFDVIRWEVWCPTGPALSLVSRVFVAAIDDSHPVLQLTDVSASHGLPVLLSSAMFQASDVDSALSQITIRAHHSQGSSLRMESIQKSPCFKQTWHMVSSQCLLAHSRELVQFTMQDLEELKVWYFPDNSTNLNEVELTVMDPFRQGPELYILYVVVSLSPPSLLLEISTSEPYPRILRNRPLPLHRADPMLITPYFLFSQAPPFTFKNVRYHVEAPPTGGYLCNSSRSGSCSGNLEMFTQLQLSQREVVYQPHSNNSGTADSFTFILSVSNFFPLYNVSYVFQLAMPPPQVVTADVPLVLEVGKVRIFSAAHFKTFSDLLQTKQVNFTVSQLPQFGWLVLHQLTADGKNKTVSVGHHFSFSFEDVESGRLSYSSSLLGSGGELCDDGLELECVSASGSLQGRVSVVFRHSGGDALSVVTQPRSLVASRSFTLTTEDMTVRSPYCPQWVWLQLLGPPSLGHLVVKDDACLTERLLVKGSMFTAQDIQMGVAVYHLSSSLSVNETIEDIFHVRALDPSTPSPIWSMSTEVEVRDTHGGSNVSIFTVRIPPSGQTYELELAFAPEFPLTWLPEQQSYGYKFHSADIERLNTSLPLHGVLLRLDKASVWGSLQVSHVPVAAFSLADLAAGRVTFLKNRAFHDGLFGEQLEMGVYAYLPMLTGHAQTLHMEVVWSVFELDQRTVEVSETQATLHLSIRRRGPVSFRSEVVVATHPITAVAQNNCSTPYHLSASSVQADFCHTVSTIVFEVGAVSMDVAVVLINDQIAEGRESFLVSLVEGEGLVNAVLSGNRETRVTITDYEDYNSVRILGNPGRDPDCDMEMSVKEDQGSLVIPLYREGFAGQELSVVCYTEDMSASGGLDYVSRPANSPSSLVTFAANSSFAVCMVKIINDQLYELREQFIVRLAPTQTQEHVSMPSLTSLCVFICFDLADSPMVVFQKEPVLVQERKTKRSTPSFSLHRQGPDLNLTTTVKYHKVVRPGDTAVEGKDYLLYTHASPGCSLEGDHTPGGCVQFSPSQTSISLSVVILPDTILEGDEVFHLRIVYVREGRKSPEFYRSTLTFTILDATKPTYVEFVGSEVTLYEGIWTHGIPVRRHGNLEGEAVVAYSLTGVTASGGSFLQGDHDFSIDPLNQRIEFAEGQNESFCSIVVFPDSVFEGKESFFISLQTVEESQTQVVLFPNSSNLTVNIVDPEDGPQVKFLLPGEDVAAMTMSVSEPLSNQSLDLSTLFLTLIRQGNTSFHSTATVSSRDGSAKNGSDFIFKEQTIIFAEGVSSVSLGVSILANHDSDQNRSFSLELTGVPDPVFDAKYFSFQDQVEVVIVNREVRGPFFLANPQLDNQEVWGRSYSGGQFYDLPLVCISSCDNLFDTLDSSVLAGCQQQQINNSRTIYLWEVSMEDQGINFHRLNKSSIFLSPTSRELSTEYLDAGVYARCRVRAVNDEGRGGYWRTSEPVLLNRTRYQCSQAGGVGLGAPRATLTSYDSFRVMQQDMVKLEVMVPVKTASLPVVSILPSSFPATSSSFPAPPFLLSNTSSFPCSTMNTVDGSSLLNHTLSEEDGKLGLRFLSLQNHLDRPSCLWKFRVWFPVSVLIERCGAQLVTGKEGQLVLVKIITDHISFWEEVEEYNISNRRTVTIASLRVPGINEGSTTPLLPPPILTRSHTHLPLPYTFPVAISPLAKDELIFELLIFSYAPHQQFLLLGNHSDSDFDLLYVDVENGIQVLAVLVDRDAPSVSMEMVTRTTKDCATCVQEDHFFSVPMALTGRGGKPRVSLLLDAQAKVATKESEFLFHGDRVEVQVDLSLLQDIQERGMRPHLLQAWLCQRVGVELCSSRLSLLGAGQLSYYDVQMEVDIKSFNLTFSTESLAVVIFPSHWSIHILYNLSSSLDQSLPHSFSLLQGQVEAAFVLQASEEPVSAATRTQGPPGPAGGGANVTPMLFVLVSAVLVVVVCLLVITLASCASQGKARLQARTASLTAANLQDLNRDHTIQENSSSPPPQKLKKRKKCVNTKVTLSGLRRSNSTTGFPSLEGGLCKSRNRKKQKNRCSPLLQRSQSLPALLHISTLHYLGEAPSSAKRINLNKVHTRIRRLANSNLNLNSKKKLSLTQENKGCLKKREKTVDGKEGPVSRSSEAVDAAVRLVRSVGMPVRSRDQTRCLPKGQGVSVARYASFVVHSLATSARTPEPDSHPTSRV